LNDHGPGGYEFLDDIAIADIAFRAWGDSLEAVIEQAARATTHVMVDDLDSVQLRETRRVRLEGEQTDMLLFDFLQELIYYKDAERLFLLPREVTVEKHGSAWRLEAELAGEPIDDARHPTNADVKAVTFHRFQVAQTATGWEATVVLDI